MKGEGPIREALSVLVRTDESFAALSRIQGLLDTRYQEVTWRVKAIRPATTSAQIRLRSNSAPALEQLALTR